MVNQIVLYVFPIYYNFLGAESFDKF